MRSFSSPAAQRPILSRCRVTRVTWAPSFSAFRSAVISPRHPQPLHDAMRRAGGRRERPESFTEIPIRPLIFLLADLPDVEVDVPPRSFHNTCGSGAPIKIGIAMSKVEATVLLCLLAVVWAAVAARPLVARHLAAPPPGITWQFVP
jgi:hypothetical protein